MSPFDDPSAQAPFKLSRSAGPAARVSRRTALTAIAAASIAGCNRGPQSEDSGDTASSSSEIPLRVLMTGEASDADVIRTAWGMTHDKPLDIQTIPLRFSGSVSGPGTRGEDEADRPDVGEQMDRFDVAIVSQDAIGELASAEQVTELREDTFAEFDTAYGEAFPAVKNGLGNYGGAVLGLAAGAKALALLSVDPEIDCPSWSGYHEWVATLDKKASEPLGPGWAAGSFLNRCASTIGVGWLFNRSAMRAEIDKPTYVAVLEQLRMTAALYSDRELTPGEVWKAIRRGKLLGGIGYGVADEIDDAEEEPDLFDVSVFDCPSETDTDRVWFGPRTPVACLSSACRQTADSKTFIGWLTGGEQVSSLWRQSDRFSPTRVSADRGPDLSGNAYSSWLARRLQTRQVMTGLVMPGGRRYYESLDRQVLACLDGTLSADDALSETAKQWDAITDELGRDSQIVAWKRALGFGG